MTQSAWPFSGQTVSEAQFRAWARQAFGSTVYQGLTVSTRTTGRQLTVTAGLATVDGCAYMSDSTVTLNVDANTTGQPRRVYAALRLDPSTTPKIQLVTVNGPAGGGAATFTQTDTGVYEFPLAYATVTAGQSGGWSSSTSSAIPVTVARGQSAVLAQTITWIDVNASGNPRLVVNAVYDPASGHVWLYAEPTGNLSGLTGGKSYLIGTLSAGLRPQALSAMSQIHICISGSEEVWLDPSTGAIYMKSPNASTVSDGHYPRGSISYPAKGGRNMASYE
jgi:hypothetical protein